MLDTKIYEFEEVLKLSSKEIKNRHLLMGNGFSIDLDPKIFTYDSLLKYSNFSTYTGNISNIFKDFNSVDFEFITKVLQNTGRVNIHYGISQELCDKILADADNLKNSLIESVLKLHPPHQGEIPSDSIKNCVTFLKNFSSFYTLNYDVLLYWIIMNTISGPDRIDCSDGFGKSTGELAWQSFSIGYQNVSYLHGSLFLFEKGYKLYKPDFSTSGQKVIDFVIDEIKNNHFPLFVSEGDSYSKKKRIEENQYLNTCYQKFSKISGDLFVFGFSFKENDSHIFNSIKNNSRIKNIFISLRGDLDGVNNEILVKCKEIEAYRDFYDETINIYFYRAASANVWRKTSSIPPF